MPPRGKRTKRHAAALGRRHRPSQASSEDDLLSEHASAKKHADASDDDGDVRPSAGTGGSDAVDHDVDRDGGKGGGPRTDMDTGDHANISDDDDDFEPLRTGTAELADDLEALVESIAAGAIPDWKEAPDLAADLAHWISLQEIPARRSPDSLALDLSILLGDTRRLTTPPLFEPAQMANILRIALDAVDHTGYADDHADLSHGNTLVSTLAELFLGGIDHIDTSAGWVHGNAFGYLPADLLLGNDHHPTPSRSYHRGKGKGGGTARVEGNGTTPTTRLPHAPLVPHEVGTSGSACISREIDTGLAWQTFGPPHALLVSHEADAISSACKPRESDTGPVGHSTLGELNVSSGKGGIGSAPAKDDQDDAIGSAHIGPSQMWRCGPFATLASTEQHNESYSISDATDKSPAFATSSASDATDKRAPISPARNAPDSG